jgi:hypothetical protein
MASLEWQRSRRCDGGSCVEVAGLSSGEIVVRDGKDPHGSMLRFTREEWVAFIGGVLDGDFRFSDERLV